MTNSDFYKNLQSVLSNAGFYAGEIDGIPGKGTDTAYNKLRALAVTEYHSIIKETASPVTASTVPANGHEIPQAAIDLILEAEGVDQPYRWPEGESGITLGYGVDIGADPKSLDYWRWELTPEQLERLAVAKGVTGERAHALQDRFRDIKISRDAALRVFYRYTLPIETALTKASFPGADQLPPAALGALVSVVFNRGTSRKGATRVDMQDIYDILQDGVQAGDLKLMAKQFRDMKTLWAGKGLDGLIARREAEADLIESCI